MSQALSGWLGKGAAVQNEPPTNVVVRTVATNLAPTHYAASADYNEMVVALLHQAADLGDLDSVSKI